MRASTVLRSAAAVSTLAFTLACNESFIDPDTSPFADVTLAAVTGATGTPGGGSAEFRRPELGLKYLDFIITLNNVTGVTAVHLHDGAAGPVMFPIYSGAATPTINGVFIHANFGESELVPDMTLDQFRDKIAAGQVYLDVHTTANPNGQLLGQLSLP